MLKQVVEIPESVLKLLKMLRCTKFQIFVKLIEMMKSSHEDFLTGSNYVQGLGLKHQGLPIAVLPTSRRLANQRQEGAVEQAVLKRQQPKQNILKAQIRISWVTGMTAISYYSNQISIKKNSCLFNSGEVRIVSFPENVTVHDFEFS